MVEANKASDWGNHVCHRRASTDGRSRKRITTVKAETKVRRFPDRSATRLTLFLSPFLLPAFPFPLPLPGSNPDVMPPP